MLDGQMSAADSVATQDGGAYQPEGGRDNAAETADISHENATRGGINSVNGAENDVSREALEPNTEGGEISESIPSDEGVPVDYAALMREDLASLKASFPELAGLGDISELKGALRYAALRDLGLTAQEAYMAACAPRTRRDNRAHLSTAITRGASASLGGMSQGELHAARELFGGMSDADIYNLYKRVNK